MSVGFIPARHSVTKAYSIALLEQVDPKCKVVFYLRLREKG